MEVSERKSTYPPTVRVRFTGMYSSQNIIFSPNAPSDATQIINREWEYGRKRGFRCVFERGVLSLYFNFKSLWYRK